MPRLTGLSPRQEQRLQERLLIRMSAKYESRYRNEVQRAMMDMAMAQLDGNPSGGDTEHRERIRAIVLQEYDESFSVFGGRILDASGKAYHRLERKFDEVPITEEFDRRQREWIQAWGGQKVTQITNTTHEQVMRIVQVTIATGIAEGLGEQAIARLLQQAIREQGSVVAPVRARTISRTEGHNAASAASREAAKSTGIVVAKEWAASPTERTREYHADADGQRVGLDDAYQVGGDSMISPGDPSASAEQVINCFTGDTQLSFDSCNKSIKSLYNGKLITIKTSSGNKVTVTPNHPIMTSAGIVSAGSVTHGDHLFCCPLNVNITGDFDVENVQTTFEQAHNALSVVPMSVRVAGVDVNLYGRAISVEDVDIVSAEGFLRDHGKAELFEFINKFSFKESDLGKAGLFGLGLLDGRGLKKLARHTLNRIVSGLNLAGSLLRGHASPLKSLRLGLTPDGDAGRFENLSYSSATHAEHFSDSIFTDSGFVGGQDCGDVASVNASLKSDSVLSLAEGGVTDAEMFSQFLASKSRFVELDKVVSIDVVDCHNTPVYTVETNEGFYNAGGIIARNCRCCEIYHTD
ncbi:head protein [Idiomarinaceae phage 1N2-2]|uniref:head protein n=1 Tax=Idiomarinaceae phage 1N2-2 TaxID=1536592 RepID=UPI0004F87716|nr:head protein [Idiomarinaceae phage 1N2-2]AIM40710.1 putative minor capsid morphogenesis protein [Idiomarinaceae phage 1N2-2]